jgi:DNA segregation ATPase FtsK/SpoIIIE, S-DNA-T family
VTTSTQDTIDAMLRTHRVDARVTAVTAGPTVCRYEISLGQVTTVERVLRLRRTLSLATGCADLRIVTPVDGRPVMGIEIPAATRALVTLADVPISPAAPPLTLPVGADVGGAPVTTDLAALPHLLIAGSTGGGKSSFLNAALTSLLTRADPRTVRMVMIDLKFVELAPYADAPHLLWPVITDADGAQHALSQLVDIGRRRYREMRRAGVRCLADYNAVAATPLPYIVVVIDELAEVLMTGRRPVEHAIARIAQVARAAGIHLVVATQSPRHDVVSGMIKVNIPGRIAFRVPKATDSRIVLDQGGAQSLLGAGDGLFLPAGTTPTRFQGALVSDVEIRAAVTHWPHPTPPPMPAVTAPLPPAAEVRPARRKRIEFRLSAPVRPKDIPRYHSPQMTLARPVVDAVVEWHLSTGRPITRAVVASMITDLKAVGVSPAAVWVMLDLVRRDELPGIVIHDTGEASILI